LFVCSHFISNAQEIYSKVRIDLQEIGLEQIANLGIDLTEGTYSKGKFLNQIWNHGNLLNWMQQVSIIVLFMRMFQHSMPIVLLLINLQQ